MRRVICILNLILIFSRLQAQTISSDEPERIFSERIFIHTDRSTFVAGDTIWFKAYLFNGNYPGTSSTDFYVDLVNETGDIVDSKKLPITDGTVYGNFELPDSLLHGLYFLRAYTRLLVSQGNKDGVFKSIAIINPDNIPTDYRSSHLPDNRINFFLESGSFVKGLTNTIIFKATDQHGNGVPVSGIIINSTGDTIKPFKDTWQGLGMFTLEPENDKNYFAEIVFKDGTKKKYDLPEASSEGILLRLAENTKGKIFQVERTDGANAQGNLSLTGFMFNRIIFQEPLKFNDNTANGLIPVSNLPQGVLNLAVTDDNNKVYARRPVFVSHPDITAPLSLKLDTISFLPKAKNSFTLTLPDSAEGNFSVAVIAYDERSEVFSNNKITSSLFWDAEKEMALSIKSVELNNTDKQTRAVNDLLLITEKQKPLKEITGPAKQLKENYIEISGDVFREGTHKPVTNGELVFLVHTKDSSTAMVQAPIQADGTFTLNNLVFDDMAKFNYRMAGKRPVIVDIRIKDPGERFRLKNKMPAVPLLPADRIVISDPAVLKDWAEQKKSLVSSAQGKMLAEVVVTARTKKPVDIVNKDYTTGMFTSMNASVFDFVNDPAKPGSQRILDYLQGKIAGLTIERSGGTYRVTSTRAMSLTGGLIPVQIFLNEMPIEPEILLSYSVSDVALVKYFKAGSNMMAGFGISGRLAIYTKKPEDINFGDIMNAKAFIYRGYSSVQDYTVKDHSGNTPEKDNRTTLYWNPNAIILSGDNELKVRFYNSVKAQKFKIIVQGFTFDGRLIDFEKIIEGSLQ